MGLANRLQLTQLAICFIQILSCFPEFIVGIAMVPVNLYLSFGTVKRRDFSLRRCASKGCT